MRFLWKLALVVLLIPLATHQNCASENTFVVLNLEAGSPLVAGVARVDVEMKLGDKAIHATLEPGGEIAFPTAVTIDLGSGAGPVVVTASARDQAAREVAQGTGAVEVVAGTTAALTIRLLPLDFLELTPKSAELGLVAPGGRAEATFAVRNAGQIPTGGLTVTLTGGDFVLASNGCMAALPPAWTCKLKVELRPTTPGNKTAKLTVSAGPGGTVEATLSGTGSWYLWSKRLGGPAEESADAVAVDGSGNVLVAGSFHDKAEFGGETLTSAGYDDIFLAKYAADGRHLWSKRFGGIGSDRVRAVAVDGSGNVLLAGYFGDTADFGGGPLISVGLRSIFIAKYDPNGTHRWSKRFGGSSMDAAYAQGLAVDAGGNVLIAGEFEGAVDLGGGLVTSAGSSDAFVAKYDPNGTHLWSKRIGALGSESASAIALDRSGGVLLAGDFAGTTDFGGGPLTSSGGGDVFLVKYNAGGTHLFSRRFGGTDEDQLHALAVDRSGNVLIAGEFRGIADFGGGPFTSAGQTDIFVAKYDGNGSPVWSRRLGGVLADSAQAVAVDGSGEVLIAGDFAGTADFGGGPLSSTGTHDGFIVKYDAAGMYRWSKRFGGAGSTVAEAVAIDGSGNGLLIGEFNNKVDFGGDSLLSAGKNDGFLLKVAP